MGEIMGFFLNLGRMDGQLAKKLGDFPIGIDKSVLDY